MWIRNSVPRKHSNTYPPSHRRLKGLSGPLRWILVFLPRCETFAMGIQANFKMYSNSTLKRNKSHVFKSGQEHTYYASVLVCVSCVYVYDGRCSGGQVGERVVGADAERRVVRRSAAPACTYSISFFAHAYVGHVNMHTHATCCSICMCICDVHTCVYQWPARF